MMIAVDNRTITGETKDKPILSFYAAAVGVMFLLSPRPGRRARCWKRLKAERWTGF